MARNTAPIPPCFVCDTCGRRKVDPMTLNSTGVATYLCYQDATGYYPRCKPPAQPRLTSPLARTK